MYFPDFSFKSDDNARHFKDYDIQHNDQAYEYVQLDVQQAHYHYHFDWWRDRYRGPLRPVRRHRLDRTYRLCSTIYVHS